MDVARRFAADRVRDLVEHAARTPDRDAAARGVVPHRGAVGVRSRDPREPVASRCERHSRSSGCSSRSSCSARCSRRASASWRRSRSVSCTSCWPQGSCCRDRRAVVAHLARDGFRTPVGRTRARPTMPPSRSARLRERADRHAVTRGAVVGLLLFVPISAIRVRPRPQRHRLRPQRMGAALRGRTVRGLRRGRVRRRTARDRGALLERHGGARSGRSCSGSRSASRSGRSADSRSALVSGRDARVHSGPHPRPDGLRRAVRCDRRRARGATPRPEQFERRLRRTAARDRRERARLSSAVVSRPGGRVRARPVRGTSGLHRAKCWVTPSRGDPQDSATENRPPMAERLVRTGKGATVR